MKLKIWRKKYHSKTVLAISHQILNPVRAIQTALKIYQDSHIPEPPKNASFQIIWFYQKKKLFPYRTFAVIDQPTPPGLQIIRTFDIGILADSLYTAQGNCLETKESLNVALFGE